MDYRTRLIQQDLSLEDLDETQIISVFQECKTLCNGMEFDLFESHAVGNIIPNWNRWRDEILVSARNNMTEGIVDSFTQSLAMAICRDVADKTNTNLDLIKVSSESYQQNHNGPYSFYACIYDNIEGGNGTTSSYIDRLGKQMSLEDICSNQKQCDTSRDEKAILELLLDRSYTADTLYSLARNPQSLRDKGFSEQALFKLGRLAKTSPSITAFYQGWGNLTIILSRNSKENLGKRRLLVIYLNGPFPTPEGSNYTNNLKLLGVAFLN